MNHWDAIRAKAVDGIDLLEASLGDLNLSYYQHLSEPTFYLRDILAAISRAKDELVGPDRYLALGQKMLVVRLGIMQPTRVRDDVLHPDAKQYALIVPVAEAAIRKAVQ